MKANFIKNSMNADNAGQGHWNDPDMMLIGNGLLTEDEENTHMALWAFSKAPLIIGTDLTKISDKSLAALKMKPLIDIN